MHTILQASLELHIAEGFISTCLRSYSLYETINESFTIQPIYCIIPDEANEELEGRFWNIEGYVGSEIQQDSNGE